MFCPNPSPPEGSDVSLQTKCHRSASRWLAAGLRQVGTAKRVQTQNELTGACGTCQRAAPGRLQRRSVTAANRYTEKGGTSSLPPSLLRFQGYEKTVRNHSTLKRPKYFSI